MKILFFIFITVTLVHLFIVLKNNKNNSIKQNSIINKLSHSESVKKSFLGKNFRDLLNNSADYKMILSNLKNEKYLLIVIMGDIYCSSCFDYLSNFSKAHLPSKNLTIIGVAADAQKQHLSEMIKAYDFQPGFFFIEEKNWNKKNNFLYGPYYFLADLDTNTIVNVYSFSEEMFFSKEEYFGFIKKLL